MQESQARTIISLLKANKNSQFHFEKMNFAKILTNFHEWANYREHLGSFLIRDNKSKVAYWLVFIKWNKKNGYYLVVFPEDKKKPIIEMHNTTNKTISWKYSPRKRDGQNQKRKEYFSNRYGSINVNIPIPNRSEDVKIFIENIFNLTKTRINSDKLKPMSPKKKLNTPTIDPFNLTILEYRKHLTDFGVAYLASKGINGIIPKGQPRYKKEKSYISIVFKLGPKYGCTNDCSSRIPKEKNCISAIPGEILQKTHGQALISSFIKDPKLFIEDAKKEIANFLDESLANPSSDVFWRKLSKMQNKSAKKSREENLIDDFKAIESNSNIQQTEKESLIKARIGQGKYRESLIHFWKQCPITKCSHTDLLTASHIKPWKDSNDQERLDSFNGILLAPNIDSLFDKGLISFNNDGTMITSSLISKANLKRLGIDLDTKVPKINFHDNHLKYLKWHRENVFQAE